MTPLEFRRALHDGLGRALRDVQSVPEPERREILLDACLHNRAIDPQLDSDRGEWLCEILVAAGDFAWAAPHIVAAVAPTEEYWDLEQLLCLSTSLARRGVPGAREVLYEEFAHPHGKEPADRAVHLVNLDGIDGLLHAARTLGAQTDEQRGNYDLEYPVGVAADAFGWTAVESALRAAARSDPGVANFLAQVEPRLARADQPRARTPRDTSHDFWARYGFDDVRARIESGTPRSPYGPGWIRMWGRKVASEDDLERVLGKLANESDPGQLRDWLLVLSSRRMPRLDPRVLQLLDHADEQVAWFAHQAVGLLEHANVHRIAIERLSSGRCDAETLYLLRSNYERADEPLLHGALPDGSDRELAHGVASGLKNIVEHRGGKEEHRLLEWSYEHSGCSNCRLSAVEKLLEHDCAPRAILDECRFDSSPSIRKLVGSK